MKKEPNFVAFNLEGMHNTDKMVSSLLSTSIDYMNEAASNDPNAYKGLSGGQVEVISVNSMKTVAPSVGFPKDRIKLVSGHSFPDIILIQYNYGVEIKSTQGDSWTSTGSSIVESTRIKEAERIYMLFGKLGGKPEFRCKPYQQCLSNIAVTHSPRYLIDMNLTANENIFSKMNTGYDAFRQLPEGDKIIKLREYYKAKAKAEGKFEMPWWMGETTSVNLSFFNDLLPMEKDEIRARACILFQSLYKPNKAICYRPISLWLCNSYSMLCPNIRDFFSAGGQCAAINGQPLERPYPHIVKEILDNQEIIKSLLLHPDADILMGIRDFWDFDYNPDNLYASWLDMIESTFESNPKLSYVPIRELLSSGAKPY